MAFFDHILYPCNLNMKGSVWSALPTENISSSISKKPIILTVASMDSASFFRDKSLGAESPLSVSFKYFLKKNRTLINSIY